MRNDWIGPSFVDDYNFNPRPKSLNEQLMSAPRELDNPVTGAFSKQKAHLQKLGLTDAEEAQRQFEVEKRKQKREASTEMFDRYLALLPGR